MVAPVAVEPLGNEGRAWQVANGAPRVVRRRSAWMAPIAAAAGVAAVAGVLVVTRVTEPVDSGATLAQGKPGAAVQVVAERAPAAEQQAIVANGSLVRDARLDQYLSAHKQFGGSSALGVPSGFLRSATYEGPNR